MRSTKFIVIPVVVLLVSALFASPASAMTYVAIRYWAAQTTVSLSGAPAFRAYDNSMINLSVRRMLPNSWSLSANLDTGSNSNLAGTWVGGTASSSTYWNVNLHRDFNLQNTNVSLFLGYQSARTKTTFFGSEQTAKVDGLRIGADAMWRSGPWSFMAWGAVGISPQGQASWPGFAAGVTGPGTFNEYGALVGYSVHGWNLEAGYRWLNFGTPAGGGFLAQDFRSSGFTAGVSRSW